MPVQGRYHATLMPRKRTPSAAKSAKKPAAKAKAPARSASAASKPARSAKASPKVAAAPKVQSGLPAAPSSTPDYAGRINRLMALANDQNLDHLLVTNPLDLGYLTGFLGGDSYLFLGPCAGVKQATIVTDGRYDEELTPQRALADVILRTKSIEATAADLILNRYIQRCGIQSDHLTLAAHDAISKVMGPERSRKLVAMPPLVSQLRQVKDAYEIEAMQIATTIQEQALLAVLPTIKAGQTELEIAAVLEMEMKKRGSTRCWFDSIVGAKANGSLPHYRPGFETTAKGAPLLIDWGSTYLGYCGDMTRTFSLGTWSPTMREIYSIVKDAQELSAGALAPGKHTHEIDRIARDHIEKAGYGKEFNHGLGHGLGLSKEPPYLNPLWPDMELKVGHVVTVEPGIYLPGVGGVRIEDLYVITETGARNFCSLPKTLEWSTL
jgi:Xaa-Pro aminopeptidase